MSVIPSGCNCKAAAVSGNSGSMFVFNELELKTHTVQAVGEIESLSDEQVQVIIAVIEQHLSKAIAQVLAAICLLARR